MHVGHPETLPEPECPEPEVRTDPGAKWEKPHLWRLRPLPAYTQSSSTEMEVSPFLLPGPGPEQAVRMGDSLPSLQPTPWAGMNATIFLELPHPQCSLRAVASLQADSLAPDCHEHPLLGQMTIQTLFS